MKSARIFTVFCFVTLLVVAGCGYWARVVFWNASNITDYKKFPERAVSNAPPVFNFRKNIKSGIAEAAFGNLEYKYKKKTGISKLEPLLVSTGTTAFIVIKDDVILYEGYFNGYKRDSINTSFSVAKSFVSALIGIAIDEGLIKSVDSPITEYLPELKNDGFEKITIKHLLSMNSGFKYSIWPDDTKCYYKPDLRKIAFDVKIEEPPGKYFEYNNYHPLLLGLILERATGVSVAEYLQEKIWKRLGMEYGASWSLDSEKSGFEKLESGINARAIDFAKFGRLFLNKGYYNGQQIISEKWVEESATMRHTSERENYYRSLDLFSKYPKLYYKYLWWGFSGKNGEYDFMALGHLGQIIYISPAHNIIIVRFGKRYGKIDFWPDLFRDMAEKSGK